MKSTEPANRPVPARRRTKQAAILSAAERLLRAQGFEQTSMDAVAREAGVSKATLYVYFSGKNELFAQLVADEGERHSTAIARAEGDADLAPVLLQAAEELSTLILSPGNIAITRMAVTGSADSADLGPRFFEAGPDALLQHLSAVLDQAMQRGAMAAASPRLAAAQFINLVVGEWQIRALLGVPPPVDDQMRRDVAIAGAQAFMRAYGISPAPR